MKLDTTFLSVHPATAAWWAQRDQCEACSASYHETLGGMRCRASPQARNQIPYGYCIDARDDEGVCGPQAKLFMGRHQNPTELVKNG